jgi:hypothetical protein
VGGGYTDSPASSIAAALNLGSLAAAAADEMGVIALYEGRSTAATTVGIERKYFQRSSGGVTPTNTTPGLLNTRSGTAQVTYTSVWGTAPTVAGNPLVHVAAPFKHENTMWWRPPRPYATPMLFNAEQASMIASVSASAVQHIIHDSAGMGRGSKDLRGVEGRRPRRYGWWGYRSYSTKYCHSAATPAYDVHRRTEYNWCARVW